MVLKIAIAGCCGRMGQAIARAALADSVFAVGAAFEAPRHPLLGTDYGTALGRTEALGITISDDAKAALSQADVLIEFTGPEPTMAHVALAKALKKPMVIGTTGLSDDQQAAVREAATVIPVVFSPNMSLAVNVLFELAQLAAERLGLGYDAEVIESHHKQKKDAPSGTAKRLADVLSAARKQPPGSIPVHAVRAGDIVGDHTVILAGLAERLELTHRAQSREVFAQGALRAAQFAVKQRPGLYDMSHVLKWSA